MFGNLSTDDIIKGVQNREEFYIPVGGQGITAASAMGGKVAKAGVSDFLRAAKRRVRRSNPIAPNKADYVNWILYDRISVAAAAAWSQLTKLFVIPIGGSSKTKVDTNLELVSQLSAPQWFNCTGIGFYFSAPATLWSPAPVDIYNFLNSEYMEFWVSQKVYAEGPMDQYPAGGGVMNNTALGTMTAAATSYITSSNNGWPSVHNMYDVRLPAGLPLGRDENSVPVVADGIIGITILQSQTFHVELKADGGGATMSANGGVPVAGVGLTVSCRLHGVLSRGVQ